MAAYYLLQFRAIVLIEGEFKMCFSFLFLQASQLFINDQFRSQAGVLILLGDCVIVVMQLRHDVSVVALLQEHLLSFLSFSRVKSVKYNYI